MLMALWWDKHKNSLGLNDNVTQDTRGVTEMFCLYICTLQEHGDLSYVTIICVFAGTLIESVKSDCNSWVCHQHSVFFSHHCQKMLDPRKIFALFRWMLYA